MKKTSTTVLAILLFTLTALGQIEKGSMLVGGNLMLEHSTSKVKEGNRITTMGTTVGIMLDGRFGYFFAKNLVAGGTLEITGSNWKPDHQHLHDRSTATFGIGPFARYYFPLNIFLEGSYAVGLSAEEQQYDFDVVEEEYKRRRAAVAVGYAAFLNEKIALEPMFGYQSIGEKRRFDATETDIESGLFIRVGFQVYLR